MRTNKKSNKKNALFPIACIVLCILVLLLLFLVKKDEIFTNLKQTDFFGRIFGATPEVIEKHEVKNDQEQVPLKDDIIVQVEDPVPVKTVENNKNQDDDLAEGEIKTETEKDLQSVDEKDLLNEVKNDKTEQKKQPKEIGNTQVELCFVMIDGDGSVLRKTVKRSVSKNDSPLTTAINLLLAGPDLSNKTEASCMTLIPEGSKLLSARVSDGVAYLNFNDVFEFNPYGVEGSIHQLEQIVYTATSFSTVNSVQFLIEGNKREYLGSEGQWIGSPLSRASF